jgi:hypothetical protein
VCVLARAHPAFQGQGHAAVMPDASRLGVVPHASVFRPWRSDVFVQVVFTHEPRPCAPQRQGHGFTLLLHALGDV